jgi:GNAT superfamily N-acetyltransferase
MMWWTGPATQPPDLGMHLERHGFTYGGDEIGMAIDLTKLNEGQPTPSGLIIEQVDEGETLKQWCHVCTVGFGFPEFVSPAFFDLLSSIGFSAKVPIRHYLGRLNGEPVASSSLLLEAGVAGIYNVATIPEARQRGIGAQMTLEPLIEARSTGYKVGILQASDMGASVYSKLGFKEYCKIGTYIYKD